MHVLDYYYKVSFLLAVNVTVQWNFSYNYSTVDIQYVLPTICSIQNKNKTAGADNYSLYQSNNMVENWKDKYEENLTISKINLMNKNLDKIPHRPE